MLPGVSVEIGTVKIDNVAVAGAAGFGFLRVEPAITNRQSAMKGGSYCKGLETIT